VRTFVLALPPGDQERRTWQQATELMLAAVESGGVRAATDAVFFALFMQANVKLE